jgi:hypothetical protein
MAQAYKVKLKKNHTAEPDQITKDGYLADDNGEPFIYNQTAAKDKAEKFGGTPEKFGKSYTTSKVKMIQFDQKFLNQITVASAREKSCYDNGNGGMFICYGNIFDELLEMNDTPAEIVDELKALSVFCVDMDYVHFL